jgi:soluble lytic murein transglycosylase
VTVSPITLLLFAWGATACDRGQAATGANPDTVVVAGATDTIRVSIDSEGRALLARARDHDRANRLDSARVLYLEAAQRLPSVADWLRLRAAGVTGDSAQRARLYAQLSSDVARDRIAFTEAFARERTGDIAGAVRAYAIAGAPLSVIRLRHARAADETARARVRQDLLSQIMASAGSDLGRDAIVMFDQLFPRAPASDQLAIARAAATNGQLDRAVKGFTAGLRAGQATARDRFIYGTVLARLNRDAAAAAQFSRVSGPPDLAAAAQYQRARAQIAMRTVSGARRTLRDITVRWATDTSAASALMLLADLAADENRDAPARATLLMVPQRFPSSRHAPVAAFRAAMIAFIQGNFREAENEFARIIGRYPSSEEVTAARYWVGRSAFALGERARADSIWQSVIAADPGSYYAVLSTQRLGRPISVGDTSAATPIDVPEVRAAIGRAALLNAMDMEVEARHEYDRLFRDAPRARERMIATAEALSGTAHASRAIALGWRLINEVGRTARHYRIVYPVVERERIVSASRANGLDPVLVAALIRQESSFNPLATSPAGARGLMQVMPDLGRSLAGRQGIANYRTELLYDPAVNITLGTAHLKNTLSAYPDAVRALAAYNAGASRVRRWSTKAGARDPEVFTERIPFVETRGYVRAVLRNRAFYRELYSW